MRALLAPLPMPVHVLPGNHDDRAAMRAAFPLEGDGEYRYVTDIGGVRLVVCDSMVPGRPEGRLDVAWLEAQLDAPQVVLAMHHPPFGVGVPALDEIAHRRARQRGARRAAAAQPAGPARALRPHAPRGVRRRRRLRRVHRARRAPDRPAGARRAGYEVVAEPPAFALHVLVGGSVTTHVQPIER